jgi:glycosyltransferase involved in cell wall biosynthesis
MKILFIGNTRSKFINDDYNLLKQDYNVILLPALHLFSKDIFNIFKYLNQARKCDLIYSWWLTSYFSVILGLLTNTKVILIAGGFDCMNLPDIKYGVFTNKSKTRIVNFSSRFTSYIIFVSNNLKGEFMKNSRVINNWSVVNLGFDSKEWYFLKDTKKVYDYITVTSNTFSTNMRTRHLIKGIDLFVKHALRNPFKKYLLIGCAYKLLVSLEKQVPKNITFKPYSTSKELLMYYNQSRAYIQSSRFESFGCTPIEAMLCGCKVILFNQTGILSEKGIKIEDLTFENRRLKLNKIINKLVNK